MLCDRPKEGRCDNRNEEWTSRWDDGIPEECGSMILLSSMWRRGVLVLAIEGPEFGMLADRSGDKGQGPLLDMHSEESVTYF